MRKIFLASLCVLTSMTGIAQTAQSYGRQPFSRADSLRGGITPQREWWNVVKYDLHVSFDQTNKSISGFNHIQYQVLKSHAVLQLDLMEPLAIDSVVQEGQQLTFKREGSAHFVQMKAPQHAGELKKLTVYYHGIPIEAKRPPWDGGVIWSKDKMGRPWISVACQGMGASVWYPNKDHQYDEPDSASLYVTVADTLTAVANGRLKGKTVASPGYTTYHWAVSNPINNYTLIPYIGKYAHFSEVVAAEKGNLDVSYWVLDYRMEDAKRHMQPDVRRTIKNLEYWFGPYPFYEDGFKMVESPHLGMEHQSAIAYGNGYQNGYLGRDLSGSGWGLKWDFIIVHESAHEWFGNNISTKDLADMWVHEGFANYSETLFTESEYGKAAGTDYVAGTRTGIRNDRPIIAVYGVNAEGSGDMYPKGGNMIHMIRQIMNDDEKFRQMIRGLNKEFYHQTVTTKQIEDFMISKVGRDISKVFDQYLRAKDIPILTYSVQSKRKSHTITYRWTNCIEGFDMPVKILVGGKPVWLNPTTQDKTVKVRGELPGQIVDRNFYVRESRAGN